MTINIAYDWLAYATRTPVIELKTIGLDDDHVLELGRMLAANPMLNPPRHRPVKTGEFVCVCGCGKKFTREYRTTHPKYYSESHRQMYWRRKKRAEEQAQ